MTTESWGQPSHTPNEEAEAKKHTGTSSKILRGEQKEPFGIGTMGVATQEKITVTRKNKARGIDLVTKYFTQRDGPDSLESAVSAFKMLKEAGVTHLPVTYREIGPSEIVMTDYNHGGRVAIGGNRNEKAKEVRIESIHNLPELLSSIDEDLRRAANAKIRIHADSFFFLIPTSGKNANVDFVIGDFGGITRTGGNSLYLVNVMQAGKALLNFILLHVSGERYEEYEKQIRGWVASAGEKPDADALANEAMDRGA